MKITEKLLLDNYAGINNVLDNLSIIDGERITWAYRSGFSDGYNPVVANRSDAAEITLEYDRVGTIQLDPECSEHEALAKISLAYSKKISDCIL